MALSICTACTARYAPCLDRCPHCGSRESIEEGQEMPKTTRLGGPSNAADLPAEDTTPTEPTPVPTVEDLDADGSDTPAPPIQEDTEEEPTAAEADTTPAPVDTTPTRRRRSAR